MKLVNLEKDLSKIVVNVEHVEWIVPEGDETVLHFVSGSALKVDGKLAQVVERLTG